MNIQEYKEKREEISQQQKQLLDFCKQYVTDQSIDVWERWQFFCDDAIKQHYNWYIYENVVLRDIYTDNKEDLQEFLYHDSFHRYEIVDVVSRYANLIEEFEMDIEELWYADKINWIVAGKAWGDQQGYTVNNQSLFLTKQQIESVFEQQMKDYVHTFTYDW